MLILFLSKNNNMKLFSYISQLFLIVAIVACTKDSPVTTPVEIEIEEEMEVEIPEPVILPFTDPENTGNWVLNEEISDDFETETINEEKWLIQGRNGEYQSNFIGRAPSQFSTENVHIEEGKLKLETRWEPEFDFSDRVQTYGNGDIHKYENITTAAVISKKLFQYGYMEIKCKAGDASVTSSFWTTGQKTELDIFEFMGKPKQSHKKHLEKEYKFSIHDWSREVQGKTVWTDKAELDWRVADDYHVYGCDWSADGLKFYADGELVRSATVEEMEQEATDAANGSPWVLTEPLRVWVDSETFPWHGLPVKEDLPVDFEIEYIRVWQKE